MTTAGMIGLMFFGALLLALSVWTKKNVSTEVSWDTGRGRRTRTTHKKGYYVGLWGWIGLAILVGAPIKKYWIG